MFEFVVPCLFGLEGPAADELRRMGLALESRYFLTISATLKMIA